MMRKCMMVKVGYGETKNRKNTKIKEFIDIVRNTGAVVGLVVVVDANRG